MKRICTLDYPSTSYEVTEEDVGKRAVIMYDNDGNFQIVKLNDSLKGMVASYCADYLLAGSMENYVHVPHLNMLQIDREGHAISDSERQEMYLARRSLVRFYIGLPTRRVMRCC